MLSKEKGKNPASQASSIDSGLRLGQARAPPPGSQLHGSERAEEPRGIFETLTHSFLLSSAFR